MSRSPAQDRVDQLMGEMTQRVYEHLDEDIKEGKFTEADVKKALAHGWDLGDHYQDWVEEA